MLQVLAFGRVTVRVAERVLLVDGEPMALGARAFDVLVALAERSDRVVSKAELLDLVWEGLVVEENNLTVQISTLRRVLGAAAITTIPGRGYRLTLPRDSLPPEPASPRFVSSLRSLTLLLCFQHHNHRRLIHRRPAARQQRRGQGTRCDAAG